MCKNNNPLCGRIRTIEQSYSSPLLPQCTLRKLAHTKRGEAHTLSVWWRKWCTDSVMTIYWHFAVFVSPHRRLKMYCGNGSKNSREKKKTRSQCTENTINYFAKLVRRQLCGVWNYGVIAACNAGFFSVLHTEKWLNAQSCVHLQK